MAESYVQASFAFTCTAAESARLEEAWQYADDFFAGVDPGEPSAEFLGLFPPARPDDIFSGFRGIFSDADFPDFGAEIEIRGAEQCEVFIFGLIDFQPDPIAELIRRCCQETLRQAPIGFDWSLGCTKAYRDNFGGGWCAIFPDRVEFKTTRAQLSQMLTVRDIACVTDNMLPDPWIDDPEHPWADWVSEVANNDTRLGYLDWTLACAGAQRGDIA